MRLDGADPTIEQTGEFVTERLGTKFPSKAQLPHRQGTLTLAAIGRGGLEGGSISGSTNLDRSRSPRRIDRTRGSGTDRPETHPSVSYVLHLGGLDEERPGQLTPTPEIHSRKWPYGPR